MKNVNLWLLVALLAVGSLEGCSRAYTAPPFAPDRTRKSFETDTETQNKPSACIKWVHGSGRTKPLRKAVKISEPAAVGREKQLQADNEDHSQ
jgi:hypothetical protein